MPTLQELRDQRASAWAQAQDFLARSNRGDDLSPEDDAAWTRALDEVDTLGEQIARSERTAALESSFADIDEQTRDGGTPDLRGGDPGGSTDPTHSGSDAAYRAAFNRFCRFGLNELEPAELQLLREHFDAQLRAQGVSTGAAGGYTVPTGFWAKVTETMKYFGGAIEGAELLTTSDGRALPWPTLDDTGSEGYYLGENTQATGEGDLNFGMKELDAHTAVSGPILLGMALAQDSGVDIEGIIARKMGERIARRSNRAFTVGTGVKQPFGYVTGLTTGKTTNSATAIAYDELVDLIHSVDAAYRATGRCRWKFHDKILAALRKLRDDSGASAGTGRPIWEPSVQAGVPDLLLGYPYTINNDMADAVATKNKTVAFGDFQSAFVVRKVAGGQMMRLTERYADYLQIGFIGFERHDSLVQDPSAAKLLVQA